MSGRSDERIREIRLHRVAEQQGLRLRKRRDLTSGALDGDGWWLIDPNLNAVVHPSSAHQPAATLDQIAAWLSQGSKPMTRQQYVRWRWTRLRDEIRRSRPRATEATPRGPRTTEATTRE